MPISGCSDNIYKTGKNILIYKVILRRCVWCLTEFCLSVIRIYRVLKGSSSLHFTIHFKRARFLERIYFQFVSICYKCNTSKNIQRRHHHTENKINFRKTSRSNNLIILQMMSLNRSQICKQLKETINITCCEAQNNLNLIEWSWPL